MTAPPPDQDGLKRQAAEASLADVHDGMVLGLGTGSTAALMIEALARRVQDGLRVRCIPTSERSADQARTLGIPLTTFADNPAIDLTIDGADEVHTGTLDLIKGLGGALLREKIVATASRRMTVIVDAAKLVPRLGQVRLPVEVVRFGWEATRARVRALGLDPALRGGPDAPFLTDGGNHILDCAAPDGIADPAALHAALKRITGVVETGLFIGIATTVIAGTPGGIRTLERPQ